MDILLIYIIKAIMLPPGSLLLMAFFGLILIQKQYRLGTYILVISLCSLYVLSMPVASRLLAATLEKYPAVQISQLQGIDNQAIIVLGGGTRTNAPEYESRTTVRDLVLDRLRYAARLSKALKLPILVSGGQVFVDGQPTEAELMAEVMELDFHAPVSWQEKRSRNTAENARFSYTMLENLGINRVILITHAIHMSRAVEQFRKVGFQVSVAPTVFLSKETTNGFLGFLPSASALQLSQMALHEQLGTLWYRLRYKF